MDLLQAFIIQVEETNNIHLNVSGFICLWCSSLQTAGRWHGAFSCAWVSRKVCPASKMFTHTVRTHHDTRTHDETWKEEPDTDHAEQYVKDTCTIKQTNLEWRRATIHQYKRRQETQQDRESKVGREQRDEQDGRGENLQNKTGSNKLKPLTITAPQQNLLLLSVSEFADWQRLEFRVKQLLWTRACAKKSCWVARRNKVDPKTALM